MKFRWIIVVITIIVLTTAGILYINIGNFFSADAEIAVTYEQIRKATNDKYGNVLAEMYFDKPILSGDKSSIVAINNLFENEVQGFFYGSEESIHFKTSDCKQFFEYVEAMRRSVGDVDLADSPLFNKVDTEVTYLDEKIISFRETLDWMAGGVRNIYYYGITVDLNTGELLTLNNFIGMDIKSFNNRVISVLYNNLKDNWDEYNYNNKITSMIEMYDFKDYEFYYDGKNTYLIFNTGIFNNSGYILQMPN